MEKSNGNINIYLQDPRIAGGRGESQGGGRGGDRFDHNEDHDRNILKVILAGGKGKRMGPGIPKVFRRLGDQSMIDRVIEGSRSLPGPILVVFSQETLDHALKNEGWTVVREVVYYEARIFKLLRKNQSLPGEEPLFACIQEEANGTGGALKLAMETYQKFLSELPRCSVTLILSGDAPLFSPRTLRSMADLDGEIVKAKVAVTQVENAARAHGFGRVIFDAQENFVKITEQKTLDHLLHQQELSLEQYDRLLTVNGGLYSFSICKLAPYLSDLQPDPITQELYLPPLLQSIQEDAFGVVSVHVPFREIVNVNNEEQRREAEALAL